MSTEQAIQASNEPDAQALVTRLIDEAEMTPDTISEAMERRVSSRTIYRWARGESVPQQRSDLDKLIALVQERCK